ncbi:hypothetical protein G7Y89_g10375 [Cudoniella acicularis]|uniref:Mid2 domain-containing protein n=1 Tax=Cudoniella acicularis TaxID=354080 RepID=A0A8H4W1P7_9HELO|nr:hypothetical protein G7Y89_g10375 [Cudoniella acicularis]
MNSILLVSLLLNFLFSQVAAQNSITSQPSATTSSVSLTPEMSASAASSLYSVLATSSPQQPGNGPSAGDVGSTAGTGDNTAGASGTSSGSITLSKGAIIALVVIAAVVCIIGITTSVLWYFAKKRSWEVRKTIRRSAKRVATALTPRRSTFPKDIQSKRSNRGLTKIEEVPNTPRIPHDLEKGDSKMASFEMSEPPKKSKVAKKVNR